MQLHHSGLQASLASDTRRRPSAAPLSRHRDAVIKAHQFGPSTSGCDAEQCSASFVSSKQNKSQRKVATQAVVKSKELAEKWWKVNSSAWVDIHDAEQFEREVYQSSSDFVLVDFFATWCHGCQKAYPELCKLAQEPEFQKHFKFVKVCVDELRSLARQENVKSLPVVHIYKPGEGQLVAIEVPFSKLKNLRTHLRVIVGNPGKDFVTDPNGFVIPIAKQPKAAVQAEAERKAAAAALLNSSSSGLFEKLLASANGSSAKAAAAASSSETSSSETSSSNGNGSSASTSSAAAAAPAAAPSRPMSPQATDPAQALAKADFLRVHGREYGYSGLIDKLYAQEVGCRMKPNEHYMDYTGSSVYCQSQLDAIFEELRSSMYGNPHSANPSSHLSSEKVEEVRELVLRYFRADPAEYQVVFTRGATASLKIVGETFPWGPGSTFRYLRENHNSVLGIREYALKQGGAFQATNESFVEQWLAADGDVLPATTAAASSSSGSMSEGESGSRTDASASGSCSQEEVAFSMFAFPAEDNFAGVKYPLSWIQKVQDKSTEHHRWKVLVDAAAYVPTQPLDLSAVRPDFVAMSFYKMFGYPTGLGALLVRVDAAEVLNKVFWGGGTVALATSSDHFHVLKCRPSDKLEDGTVSFLDIMALKHGFGMFDRLGGISAIQAHVASLSEYLYKGLAGLRHSNGAPMVQVFGKHHLPNARQVQGGILNFEVLSPSGQALSYKTFEKEAAEAGFHVRTGAECNPGACYNYLGVQESEVEALAGQKEGCHDDMEFIKVPRPATCPAPAVSMDEAGQAALPAGTLVDSATHLASLGETPLALGHPAEVAMKWVQVPLGSVRASLGYMSTFEDCYALVRFVEKQYKDRKV